MWTYLPAALSVLFICIVLPIKPRPPKEGNRYPDDD